MKQETIQKTSDGYKACSQCGQGEFPFKLGVCLCGNQVGEIQYVKDPKQFVKNYYRHEKYDTAVEETFAGIPEVEY